MKTIKYLKKPRGRVYIRKEDEQRLKIAFLATLGILLVALIILVPRTAPSLKVIYHNGQYILEQSIRPELVKRGFQPVSIESSLSAKNIYVFNVPTINDLESSEQTLTRILNQYNLLVNKAITIQKGHGNTYYLKYYSYPIGSITLLKGLDYSELYWRSGQLQHKPKLAIIIDDFGYTNNNTIKGFLKLDADLTLSVIPGHRYSKWVAGESGKYNKEITIHMPMEPEDKSLSYGEESYMLHKNLRPFQIRERIQSAIMELPQAKGMNNHMGSAATADSTIMANVAAELKTKNLYFIDSLTSPHSIAYEIAKKTGVPASVRTVFLDNIKEKAEIYRQFDKAVSVAKLSGQAVIIGHVYPETLEVLSEILTAGSYQDIAIVFASEIVS